jgi:hypothetical protein
MSLWTLIKLLALTGVLAIMAFTGLLGYHIWVAPLGGILGQMIPTPSEVAARQTDADFAKNIGTVEMPNIDPGERVFQKAHELLALGKLNEAREKLTSIVNVFPSSSSAPVARRIVGEMNLDEVLSAGHREGKQIHTVKRGNSFLSIAGEYKTSIDCIMYLNSMMELKNIQPGEELLVMPLNFRLLIEPQRKLLSIWDGGRFLREYPIIGLDTVGKLPSGSTTIGAKSAELAGHPVPPQSKDYRGAEKVILAGKPPFQIRGAAESAEAFPHGILLRPEDMEEISLLTRVGNEVEVR